MTIRLELRADNTAVIRGLTPQSINAEPLGAAIAARDQAVEEARLHLIEFFEREDVPVALQNAIGNALQSGFRFVLGDDANGDIYFRGANGLLARLGIGAEGRVLTSKAGLPSWEPVTTINWAEVTGTAQAIATNTGYIISNSALVTLTLPATAPLGSVVEILGKGSGGWRLSQLAGQTIVFGNLSSTTGAAGRLLSTYARDCIRLVNITADTEWQVVSSQGNIDIL